MKTMRAHRRVPGCVPVRWPSGGALCKRLAVQRFSMRYFGVKEKRVDSTQGFFFEDLSEGMEATFAKTVTEADVVLFAGITGDLNPVHVNDEYAANTQFKGRIAH